MTGNAGPSGTDPWRDLPPSVPDARDPGDPDHPFGTDTAPAETPASPSADAAPTEWAPPDGETPPPDRPPMPPMPAMDVTTKLTLGAGFALAILGLLGVAVGTSKTNRRSAPHRAGVEQRVIGDTLEILVRSANDVVLRVLSVGQPTLCLDPLVEASPMELAYVWMLASPK